MQETKEGPLLAAEAAGGVPGLQGPEQGDGDGRSRRHRSETCLSQAPCWFRRAMSCSSLSSTADPGPGSQNGRKPFRARRLGAGLCCPGAGRGLALGMGACWAGGGGITGEPPVGRGSEVGSAR